MFGHQEKGMTVWLVPNGHLLFPMPEPIQAIALAKQLIVSNPYTLIHDVSGFELQVMLKKYSKKQ